MFIDKKCLKCPVRKFALKVVHILKTIFDTNESILDLLNDFESNIVCVENECRKVITTK